MRVTSPYEDEANGTDPLRAVLMLAGIVEQEKEVLNIRACEFRWVCYNQICLHHKFSFWGCEPRLREQLTPRQTTHCRGVAVCTARC